MTSLRFENRILPVALAALALIGCLNPTATAVDVYWIGGSSSWNTPGNWELEGGGNFVPDGDSPFNDSAFIGNSGTALLSAPAANPVGALSLGSLTLPAGSDYGDGALTISTGGSLIVQNNGTTSGNLNIGRVPSFGAPLGTTAADAQNGTLTITGTGSLTVDNRLFLERRNNANPTLTLSGSGSVTVGGDADLRGTTRITGSSVNFATNTLQFGGRLLYIPEITQVGGAANFSTISVTGAATLNVGATIRPEFTFTPVGGEVYTLVEAATLANNGLILDDSGVTLGMGQTLNLAVDRSGLTEKLNLSVDNVLTLTANRRTGAVSIGNVHNAGISIKGYSLRSPSGSLNFADGVWTSFDDQNFDGGTWSEANPTAMALNELNLTSSHTFSSGSNTSLGGVYDANVSQFGVLSADDLTFTYQTASGETKSGLVQFTGAYNSLVMRVDPASGDATIVNESPVAAQINSYSVTSGDGSDGSGSLLTTWDSLDKQNVGDWMEANPDSEALNELNLTGGLALAPGQSFTLAGLWDTSGAQDLAFRFGLVDGAGAIDGVVLYEAPLAGLPGDYNADGQVDAIDYAIWRDNLGGDASVLSGNGTGAATVVLADFDLWRNNYGAVAAPSAGAVTTPEPVAALLILSSVIGMMLLGDRRFLLIQGDFAKVRTRGL